MCKSYGRNLSNLGSLYCSLHGLTGVMSKCCRNTGLDIVDEGASGPMAWTKYFPVPVGQLLSHLSDARIGRLHSTVTTPFVIEQAVKATLLAVEFLAWVESLHAPYAG